MLAALLAALLVASGAAGAPRWCASLRDEQRTAAIVAFNSGVGASSSSASAAAYRAALALDPHFTEAALNLGALAMEAGELDEAERLFSNALRLASSAPAALPCAALRASTAHRASALNNLANVALRRAQASALRRPERFDREIAAATALFFRAHAVSPATRVDALYNAGVALREQRLHDDARSAFLRVLNLAPTHRTVQAIDLGKVAIDRAAHDALGARLRRRARGERCDAAALRARNALATWLADRGDAAAALDAAESARACAPFSLNALHHAFRLRGELLRWEGAEALAARLVALLDAEMGADTTPRPLLAFDVFSLTLLELDPRWVRRVAEATTASWSGLAPVRRALGSVAFARADAAAGGATRAREAHRRTGVRKQAGGAAGIRRARPPLRIALSSFNFRDHATGSNVRSFVAQSNASRLAVRCHSHGPDDGSPQRRTLERLCGGGWIDTWALGEVDRAERVVADGIEIFVDLVAHSHGASHGVAARRPAPLVVAAQGYPGTSGARYVDYALVDAVVVPPERRFSGGWSEKLVYMPASYQVSFLFIYRYISRESAHSLTRSP